eukprot:4270860-Lingulodinium_polyedra.AAC.1
MFVLRLHTIYWSIKGGKEWDSSVFATFLAPARVAVVEAVAKARAFLPGACNALCRGVLCA